MFVRFVVQGKLQDKVLFTWMTSKELLLPDHKGSNRAALDGGLVVRVLAFNFHNLSLNPDEEGCSFSSVGKYFSGAENENGFSGRTYKEKL